MTEAEYTAAGRIATWWEADWDGDGTVSYFVDGIPSVVVTDPANPSATITRPWGTVTFYGTPSSADAGNPLKATSDAFGRVIRVERADGHVVKNAYCGPHKQETTEKVGTSIGGTSDVSTRFYYDGLGRVALVDVQPWAGSTTTSNAADASYRYDIFGNVKLATLTQNLSANPFWSWRNGNDPAGQKRRFQYDGLGRLRKADIPEQKGVVDGGQEWDTKYLAYDVWGNLLTWQDATGQAEHYYFRNEYDVPGRLTRTTKVDGDPGTLPTPDTNRFGADGSFESGLGAWVKGNLNGTTFTANSLPENLWNAEAYGGCLPAPPGSTGRGLYFGIKSDGHCTYNAAAAASQLVRYQASGVKRSDTLTFRYWRLVRDGAGSGALDEIALWAVLGNGTDVTQRRVLFRLNEGQRVLNRWMRPPSIRIGDFFSETEWPAGQTQQVVLYWAFTKGDTISVGLSGGVVIDDMVLHAGAETLIVQEWDGDNCDSAIAASLCPASDPRANAPVGKVTAIRSYDAGLPNSARYLVFRGPGGRVSGQLDALNTTGAADEESAWPSFVQNQSYDANGSVTGWIAPRMPSGTEHPYAQARDRDFVTGVVGRSDQALIGSIAYDAAGQPNSLLFANGVSETIARDRLERPQQITITGPMTGGQRPTLWDSGTYLYDGLSNIRSVGQQQFAYDNVGRLTEARVLPQAADRTRVTTDVETFSYDAFGNQKSRQLSSQSAVAPPEAFSNRQYGGDDEAQNRNQVAGFTYDANGNALRFSGSNGQQVGAVWSAQGRINAFVEGDPFSSAGVPSEFYRYDHAGNRWFRMGRDGVPRVTLRDFGGQPAAEFTVDFSPTLQRQYVYALGKLLVERLPAVSANVFRANAPTIPTSQSFTVTAGVNHPRFTVDIRTADSPVSSISGVTLDGSGAFSIDNSYFAAGTTNYVRIKPEDVIASPFSAPVAVAVNPAVPVGADNQTNALSVSRSETDITVRWGLARENGKRTRLFFKRADTGAVVTITPTALAATVKSYSLMSQALNAPCGSFFTAQYDSSGQRSSDSVLAGLPQSNGGVGSNATDPCGGGTSPPPSSPPEFVNYFDHRDHLGNLRVMTDDSGAVARTNSIAELHDYYPFGAEMGVGGSATGSRKKFTGHERDENTGLDYMLARYHSPALGRFLSVDPGDDTDLDDPQSWNAYAYVRNNPIVKNDPDGEAGHIAVGALVGAAVGGGYELFKQIRAGEGINIAKIGTSAGKGMVVGAVAAATGGMSLLAAGSAVGGTTLVAGVAERALDCDAKTSALDKVEMAKDGVGGFLGGAAGAKVGQMVKSGVAGSAEQTIAVRQAERGVRIAEHGTRSLSRQAAAAQTAAQVAGRPEAAGKAAGSAARAAVTNGTRVIIDAVTDKK